MYSYWQKTLFDQNWDVLIIGAGFSGLNTAIDCIEREPKMKVLVVDPAMGQHSASVRNAGFACFGSLSEFLHDVDLMGQERAASLLRQRNLGVAKIAHFCKGEQNVFRQCVAHEVFMPGNRAIWEKCMAQIDKVNSLLREIGLNGQTYTISANTQVENAIGSIHIKGEGQINPERLHHMLWQKASALGVQFLFDKASNIESGDKPVVHLSSGVELKSRYVVNAVNGFDESLHAHSSVKPARAQVLITSEVEDMPYEGNYHMDEGFYYFRNVGKRLLLGGGRNLDIDGETTTELLLSEPIQQHLMNLIRNELLPGREVSIEHQWSGIMGMRADKHPQLETDGNCLSLAGMSGMGVALSFVLSEEAANRICK